MLVRRLLLTLAVGLGLVIGICGSLAAQTPESPQAVCDRYVLDGSPDIGACTDKNHPCGTVQYALGQAIAGDLICVGNYAFGPGPDPPSVYTGTIVVTKSVTLDGAWNVVCLIPGGGSLTCNYTAVACDQANVVLTGEGARRVLEVRDGATPMIRCFTISGGRAHKGGGLYVQEAAPVVGGNVFTGNMATQYGGGIYVVSGSPVITGNVVLSNSAQHSGGGVSGLVGTMLLHGNIIAGNAAADSAGLSFDRTTLTATANLVVRNHGPTAWGLSASPGAGRALMINNVITGNSGAGLEIYGYTVALLHNTVASNTYYAMNASYSATVAMTNNVFAGHPNNASILSVSGGRVVGDRNLFWGNKSDPITVTGAVLADPLLKGDGYHIRPGSAAFGRGASVAVIDDVDGEERFAAPCIGADEYVGPRIYIPQVLRG